MTSDLDIPTIVEGLYQIYGLEHWADYRERVLNKFEFTRAAYTPEAQNLIVLEQRRTGKTTYLVMKALAHAIKGETVLYGVPTRIQTEYVISLIRTYCPNKNVRMLISVNSNNIRPITNTTPQWIIIDDH